MFVLTWVDDLDIAESSQKENKKWKNHYHQNLNWKTEKILNGFLEF